MSPNSTAFFQFKKKIAAPQKISSFGEKELPSGSICSERISFSCFFAAVLAQERTLVRLRPNKEWLEKWSIRSTLQPG